MPRRSTPAKPPVEITTTGNFDHIQRCFIKAKRQLKRVQRTGVEIPGRLKGCGLEGASRTGKSWDICVFICHYVTQYKGKQINVCRDDRAKLQKTFYATLRKVWCELFQLPRAHFNKTMSDIHYNDNIVRFVGINTDIMTAHGLESDLLVVNEAMGVSKHSLDQLEQRTKEFYIIDFNPTEIDSYLYAKELSEGYKVHKTTIFDNPYAPINSKEKILSYAHPDIEDSKVAKKAGYRLRAWRKLKARNVELKTANKYNWEVFGLGKRTTGGDTIFPEFQYYTKEPSEDKVDWFHLGGDFGFKSDPTACVAVTKVGGSLYLKELFYSRGLLTPEIAEKVKNLGYAEVRSIWDKSQEFTVHEMRGHGIDAWFSQKPPGSVAFGIQKMQQFNLYVHKGSKNLIEELRKYRWLKDRSGDYRRDSSGKRIPVDKDNHLIDAIRYVLLYRYWEPVNNDETVYKS